MNRLIRSSALTWALGYVLLGLAALGAFAVVLWYAWNVTIFVAREEILRDDAQRLADRFSRDGVAGLTAYLDARVGMQIAGERITGIEKQLGNSSDPESLALRQRADHLRGTLTWRQHRRRAAGGPRSARHARGAAGARRQAIPHAARAHAAPRWLPAAGGP